MDAGTEERGKARRIYVLAAWGSPFAGACISVALWQWIVNHPGTRGERPPGVSFFYLILLVASAVGLLAGLVSLFGIRSRQSALIIIPGAVLGICINSFTAFYSYFAHALEGVNLGG